MLRKVKVSSHPIPRTKARPGRTKRLTENNDRTGKKRPPKVGSRYRLITGGKQVFHRGAEVGHKPVTRTQKYAEARRSELRNGLTDRQRRFVLEKIAGRNDKDAALAAGYSLSVAENTKQRVWKTHVRAEFIRIEWVIVQKIREQLQRTGMGAGSEVLRDAEKEA